jgi:hypothetical protein
MADAVLSRRGGTGGSAARLTYNNYVPLKQAPDLSQSGNSALAAASINNKYALFGGGCIDNTRTESFATVNAYDVQFVRTAAPDLSAARGSLAAAANPAGALFGGGQNGAGTASCFLLRLLKAFIFFW